MPDTIQNFYIYKLKYWRGKERKTINGWNGVGDNRFDRFDSTDKLLGGNGRDGGIERRVIHSKSERWPCTEKRGPRARKSFRGLLSRITIAFSGLFEAVCAPPLNEKSNT